MQSRLTNDMTQDEARHVRRVRTCLADLTGCGEWLQAPLEEIYKWCGLFEFESADDDANAMLNEGVEPHHCGVEA